MGFERIFVGKELCCHLAIQLFASGRAKHYDSEWGGTFSRRVAVPYRDIEHLAGALRNEGRSKQADPGASDGEA
jgi:hypothetical protein